QPNGGNCYACHQLTKTELSYGTLGPSLSEYGKQRDFKPEAVKAAYEKIYNSHAALPCSTMPRFGANKILTIEQIKDAVALLMSPESPVNTGQGGGHSGAPRSGEPGIHKHDALNLARTAPRILFSGYGSRACWLLSVPGLSVVVGTSS